jgi:phosphoglycolate phosphatase
MHRVRELDHRQRKPDAEVLLEICAKENIHPSEAAYVGDSLSRDIFMAKLAGVTAIWAKYGTRLSPALYQKLVRVTHWTKDEVEREKAISRNARHISPDIILHSRFDEIIEILLS